MGFEGLRVQGTCVQLGQRLQHEAPVQQRRAVLADLVEHEVPEQLQQVPVTCASREYQGSGFRALALEQPPAGAGQRCMPAVGLKAGDSYRLSVPFMLEQVTGFG